MYCVLQISDLHRSTDDPANNHSLIAALLADYDRYRIEVPHIPAPDAIVVSGDLVQGIPLGTANWTTEMCEQYKVARELVEELAQRFLNGDHGQLIMIPGNHDVCWNSARASMEAVPDDQYPPDVRRALLEQDSIYRWSWKDRKLYRINDLNLYAKRLDFYWDFFEAFYAGVPLALPIDRKRGYQMFTLDQNRIVIAAFDSLTSNDCFGVSGAIPTGAIAKCNLALRDMGKVFRLKVALWHHSIQGPPLHEDYMDVRQIYEMAGLGFQLGLHGHQHVAATATHYVHLNERKAMAVVSGGSLCAGYKDLPRGINRQYNVIAIGDDYCSARIHVREMVEGEQFSSKRNGAFPEGYGDVSWQPPNDAGGHKIDAARHNERNAVINAESALRDGRPKDALAWLRGVSTPPSSHARDIAVGAATEARDWHELRRLIGSPSNSAEQVLLITALTQLNDLATAEAVLLNARDIAPGVRRDLEGKISLKRMMEAK